MREKREQHKVWLYLIAILTGMAIGWAAPERTAHWEILLWPVLGLLLYTTSTSVPLIHPTDAFRDRRFLIALLLGAPDRHRSEVLCTHGGQPNKPVLSPSETGYTDLYGASSRNESNKKSYVRPHHPCSAQ
uniref:hypothetical protein n=1 Tax=Marinobacterium profundum TaxID=1714300 RepID=UPI00131566FD|nr:hypothetical protein [Marinobacterium profundum]